MHHHHHHHRESSSLPLLPSSASASASASPSLLSSSCDDGEKMNRRDEELLLLPTTTTTTEPAAVLMGQPRCLSTESYSLLLLLCSTFFYGAMSCCLQLSARNDGIPSTELVFLRAIFQGTLVIGGMVAIIPTTISDDEDGDDCDDEDGDDCDDDDRQHHHRHPMVIAGTHTIANTAAMKNKAESSIGRMRLIQRPFGHPSSVRTLVVARGVVGGIGFLLYYYTMSVLPLGDAMTWLSLSPVITVAAAKVALGEAIRPVRLLASGACLLGSVLLARSSHQSYYSGHDPMAARTTTTTTIAPSSSSISSSSSSSGRWHHLITGIHPGCITGILGSCCGSAVLILIRTTGKKGVHVLQLLFSWCFFGFWFSAGVGLLGIGRPFVLPPATIRAWSCLLGVCGLGSAAHFLMNYAARYAPAGLSSIVRSASIVWGYAFEVLVFDQVPSKTTTIGVCLILVALSSIALLEPRQSGSSSAHHPHRARHGGTMIRPAERRKTPIMTTLIVAEDDATEGASHSSGALPTMTYGSISE